MSDIQVNAFEERKRLLFLGLPWTFTKYSIREDMVNVRRGFLKTVEDDCYMYKITDVKLETAFSERLMGLATVICYSGDVTDPILRLEHIKNARQIKEYILKASEEERLKRRTLTTQNIGSVPLDVELSHMEATEL
jgi:uncharacterized membrane protein YdbT with pleckstrin-like domain